MKSITLKLTVFALMIFGSMNVTAAGPSHHLSEASKNSAQAITHLPIAGVKLVSGVVAVPLIIVGEIGNISGQAGTALWEEANRPIGEPLQITDEVITSGKSPEDAMKIEGE